MEIRHSLPTTLHIPWIVIQYFIIVFNMYTIISFIKKSYNVLLKSFKQCWTLKNLYPGFYELINKVQNLKRKIKIFTINFSKIRPLKVYFKKIYNKDMSKRIFTQHQQYIIISYFFFMFSYFSSLRLITDLTSIKPNFYGLKNLSSNIFSKCFIDF